MPIASPFNDAAERLLRVRGGPPTRFSPPREAGHCRSSGLAPDISFLKSLCVGVGVEVEDSATATPIKTLRIFNVQREILPASLRSGYGTVVTGVTVKRLVAGADRRIEAAEVATLDGYQAVVGCAPAAATSRPAVCVAMARSRGNTENASA
jgi:hypothetical protein